jgi:hypothetical protein
LINRLEHSRYIGLVVDAWFKQWVKKSFSTTLGILIAIDFDPPQIILSLVISPCGQCLVLEERDVMQIP